MGNDLSRFNETFIKNYNENSDAGYFLEVNVEYPKNFFSAHHFYQKEKNWKKQKNQFVVQKAKKNMSFI